MKKYFVVILVLVVTVIFLSGCFYDLVIPESDLNSEDTEDGSSSPTQEDGVVPGKGTLKIYLTDASGNYKENDSGTYSAVYITISKIEAHIAGDNDGDNDGDKGSWEPLKKWPEGLLVNLKEFADRSMLLASLELKSNKYTQLRLFLMDEEEDAWIAWIVLNDLYSTEKHLEIPSVYQTGIKLNRPFEIVTDGITKLTIDFDAEKSVVETGNGKFKLKPVIHMTSETFPEGADSTGSVFGKVSYYGYDNEGTELILAGIDDADVSLSGGEYIFVYNFTTSGGGIFIFDSVPVGNCVLNVYADGFNPYSESIVVGEDVNEVNVVFLLEEPGGISGIVVDSADSVSPIEGTTVNVNLSGGVYTFNSSALTDVNGEFNIDQLPVGLYTLTVLADLYIPYLHAVEIEVIEDETTDIGEIGLTLSPQSP